MFLGMTCGSPVNQCSGTMVTDGIGKNYIRYHRDSKESHRCYGKYLMSQGFTRHEGKRREFKRPDDGSIQILPKKLGVPVMTGKRGDTGGGRSKRAQAKHRNIAAK